MRLPIRSLQPINTLCPPVAGVLPAWVGYWTQDGAWNAGDPPPNWIACGGSKDVELAGRVCLVNTVTGEYAGSLFVEAVYNVAVTPPAFVSYMLAALLPNGTMQRPFVPAANLRQEPCPSGAPAAIEYPANQVVCFDNAGTTTQVLVRQRLVIDSAGNTASTTTEYSTDGSGWTTTRPSGTVTPGPCTTPDVSFGTFGPYAVCYDDGLGGLSAWFQRQTVQIDQTTGQITSTVTEWSQNGGVWVTTPPTGIATVGACGSAADTDIGFTVPALVCVENPASVFTQWQSRTQHSVVLGVRVDTTEWSSDGSTWAATAPTGTVRFGSCVTAPELDTVYPTAHVVCVDNAGATSTWLVRDIVQVDNATGIVTVGLSEWSNNGTTWTTTAPVGTTSVGACQTTPPLDRV